jgi:hypothetical protein
LNHLMGSLTNFYTIHQPWIWVWITDIGTKKKGLKTEHEGTIENVLEVKEIET